MGKRITRVASEDGAPNAIFCTWEPTLALLCGPNPAPNAGGIHQTGTAEIWLHVGPPLHYKGWCKISHGMKGAKNDER